MLHLNILKAVVGFKIAETIADKIDKARVKAFVETDKIEEFKRIAREHFLDMELLYQIKETLLFGDVEYSEVMVLCGKSSYPKLTSDLARHGIKFREVYEA